MEKEMKDFETKEHTRIFLQPVAAAAILGLFAYAVALFVIGAEYGHWFNAPNTGAHQLYFIGSFAAFLGGVAQFAAAMWAFKNRDGIMTAFNGIWGAFLIGFGVLNLLFETGHIAGAAGPTVVPSVGMWFIMLAFITAACGLASLATNFALFATMVWTAAASALMGIGMLVSPASLDTMAVAGYLFMVSAIVAYYTGAALMIKDAFGHAVLPLGEFQSSREDQEISAGIGEPGVVHGEWRAFGKRSGYAGYQREAHTSEYSESGSPSSL